MTDNPATAEAINRLAHIYQAHHKANAAMPQAVLEDVEHRADQARERAQAAYNAVAGDQS